MRWLLAICVLLSLCATCQAVPSDGVLLSQERVIRLPEDSQKWYVSVVGDSSNARYKEVVGWFDTTPRLKTFKDAVHFIPVTTDTAVYTERYQKNIKGLPTVRVQDANGVVLYEEAGIKLPMSGEALYNAIANKVNGSEGWLPWKRKPEPKPDPGPVDPQPDPGPVDPAPQPIDNNGAPVLEPGDYDLQPVLVAVCVAAVAAGLALGYIERARKQ